MKRGAPPTKTETQLWRKERKQKTEESFKKALKSCQRKVQKAIPSIKKEGVTGKEQV